MEGRRGVAAEMWDVEGVGRGGEKQVCGGLVDVDLEVGGYGEKYCREGWTAHSTTGNATVPSSTILVHVLPALERLALWHGGGYVVTSWPGRPMWDGQNELSIAHTENCHTQSLTNTQSRTNQ